MNLFNNNFNNDFNNNYGYLDELLFPTKELKKNKKTQINHIPNYNLEEKIIEQIETYNSIIYICKEENNIYVLKEPKNESNFRETALLLTLKGKYTPKIYNLIPHKKGITIKMEYLGEDLNNFIGETNSIFEHPLSHPLWFLLYSLKSLHYLHKKNISHNDIKPHNLIICKKNNEYFIKFIDLGAGKYLNPIINTRFLKTLDKIEIEYNHSIISNKIEGTPIYVAPEIFIQNITPQRKNDIYSLGSIIFQHITKITPNYFLAEYLNGGKLNSKEDINSFLKNHFFNEIRYLLRKSDIDKIKIFSEIHHKSIKELKKHRLKPKLIEILAKTIHPFHEYRYNNCKEIIFDLKSYGSILL